MRYAWHHLPQDGQMDTATGNEDSDNDIEMEESGSNAEVADDDNNVANEEDDMTYVQDLLIDFSINDVEHGEDF